MVMKVKHIQKRLLYGCSKTEKLQIVNCGASGHLVNHINVVENNSLRRYSAISFHFTTAPCVINADVLLIATPSS